MKRIDAAGNVGNLFDEGNEIAGIDPTTVSADYMNILQEEICKVIESSGGTLDQLHDYAGVPAHDKTQLYAAILKHIADGKNEFRNIQVVASVASNALTLALKDKSGNTPSSTSKCFIAFRSSTLADGSYVVRNVAAALSLIIPSGAPLTTQSGVGQYLYLYALDNAGTVELAVSGSLVDEDVLQSTTGGGSGSTLVAAASGSGLFSVTARSNVAVRLLARLYVTEATAGTWASLPTEVTVNPVQKVIPSLGGDRSLSNLSLAASVASNALTVAIKDRLGNNPSVFSPVNVGFRSPTATNGVYLIRSLNAALSLTVPSGQKLGGADGLAQWLYLWAIDNAGTIELGISGSLCANEFQTVNTIAIASAPNGNVIYSASARTGVAVRLLGRMRVTETTAGTWAAMPSITEVGTVRSTPDMLTTTSSPAFQPSATSIYMGLSGSSLNLPPGIWRLYGTIIFSNSGSNPTYTNVLGLYATANGANTVSQPAVLSTETGNPDQTYGVPVSNGSVAVVVMPTVRVNLAVATTIYLVPYADETTPANARVIAYLNAERIS